MYEKNSRKRLIVYTMIEENSTLSKIFLKCYPDKILPIKISGPISRMFPTLAKRYNMLEHTDAKRHFQKNAAVINYLKKIEHAHYETLEAYIRQSKDLEPEIARYLEKLKLGFKMDTQSNFRPWL